MGREVSSISRQYAGKGCDDDGAESIMRSRNSSLLLLQTNQSIFCSNMSNPIHCQRKSNRKKSHDDNRGITKEYSVPIPSWIVISLRRCDYSASFYYCLDKN